MQNEKRYVAVIMWMEIWGAKNIIADASFDNLDKHHFTI